MTEVNRPFVFELKGTWPDELWKLDSEARHGLWAGDLNPLLAMLRSEYPLCVDLREHIARLIEGSPEEEYALFLKGRSKGRTRAQRSDRVNLKIAIGIFAEKLSRAAGRGEFDAIIGETMEEFGVSRGTATSSLAHVRALIKQHEGSPDYFERLCEVFGPVSEF